jgi:predicted ATP-grasp superfamily ATP-dependent carboligase
VRILIAGLSTRAIAESAASGNRKVVTLDYFGDRDQRALVENYALLRDFELPFGAEALLQASQGLEYDALVYISNLENHPGVVAEMSRGRRLLGNEPTALRQVRDWRVLRHFCREAGIPLPETLLPGEEGAADPGAGWLVKPQRSGGGHGIVPWDGAPLALGTLLQRRIAGLAASAAFVANGRRAVVLGLTEQLIGRPELGAAGLAWCGNLLPLSVDQGEVLPSWSTRPPEAAGALLQTVARIASQLTEHFGLRGLNGIDFVVEASPNRLQPVLVEVNPRYTASMELVERASGRGMFAMHLEAMAGRLPAVDLAANQEGPFFGKGIVFAGQRATVPETKHWLARGRRDIPYPGETIEAGHPVCTVLSQGDTRQECWLNLVAAAGAVRQEMGIG